MSINPLVRGMASRLEELKRQSLSRELSLVSGINLCSNDYLGLSDDPRLKQAVLQAMEQCERVAATGSRLLSGHDAVWDELETLFAGFAGTESALYFSSGFSANTGLLSAVLAPGDVVFSDALNHASLIDGIRLSRAQKVIYPHCDLNFLEHELRRSAEHSVSRVIVTETIFSMDGDRAPLLELFQLAERYGAQVIADEAHATGVCGPRGKGLLAELGLQDRALAVVHTCGKALASMGAFVCGSRILKEFLINHARSFIFSTAMPPYFAGQIKAALELAASMDAERLHLARLASGLRERLGSMGLDCRPSNSHIVPLIIGANEDTLSLAASLQERGFAVRAVRAPSVPEGTARLRISLTATRTGNDIEQFTNALSDLDRKGREGRPSAPLRVNSGKPMLPLIQMGAR
jgi:8-amino-7-oxononanoate synthase